MSEEKAPRPSGQLVSKNHALPPVRVDASQWPREPGPRTIGEFVSVNHALPPVTVKGIRTAVSIYEVQWNVSPAAEVADQATLSRQDPRPAAGAG